LPAPRAIESAYVFANTLDGEVQPITGTVLIGRTEWGLAASYLAPRAHLTDRHSELETDLTTARPFSLLKREGDIAFGSFHP